MKKQCLLTAVTVLAAGSVFAQSNEYEKTFRDVQNMEIARIEQGVEAQTEIDRLDDRRMELVNEYRVALKQRRDLETYNNRLRDVIQSQENEKQSIEEQIIRVGTLERDIVPMMSDMLVALENFVDLDLPFFLEERRNRITHLNTLMSRSEFSNSEKYRRILEAYQIENDYGRSFEAKEDVLPGSSTEQRVDFLKVGRLALFYQTLDGENSYRWEKSQKQWVQLNKNYNKTIRQGIRMAREKVPVDLLVLPLEMPINL